MKKTTLWLTERPDGFQPCAGRRAVRPPQQPRQPRPTEEPTAATLTELTVWADETRSPIISDLGNQFAAQYGVHLNVQEMGFGDIRDQLAVAGPAGEGPDIIIGADDLAWRSQ